jgi:hypothetical protein
MFVRNSRGKLVYINEKIYFNEYDFYIKLWKIKYNINLERKEDLKENIVSYINGEKTFV